MTQNQIQDYVARVDLLLQETDIMSNLFPRDLAPLGVLSDDVKAAPPGQLLEEVRFKMLV